MITLVTEAPWCSKAWKLFLSSSQLERGVVCSFYERQLALQCSRRVAGVRKLVDEIIVKELAENQADDRRVRTREVLSLDEVLSDVSVSVPA